MPKVKTRRVTKTKRIVDRSKTNAVNVNQGIRAEERVLDRIHEDYQPKRVTPGKVDPDKGLPDLVFKSKSGKLRYVEVKSIKQGNRAQFLKKELVTLSKNEGIVIIEERLPNHQKRYYKASAKKILDLVKGEKGAEVKIEYSQIQKLRETSRNNPLNLAKEKPTLEERWKRFLKTADKTSFSKGDLREKFTDLEIKQLLYDAHLYRHSSFAGSSIYRAI